jgi:hypothetical protein
VGKRRFFTGYRWGILTENPLRILGRRWEDNIKVDVKNMFGNSDLIHLAHRG